MLLGSLAQPHDLDLSPRSSYTILPPTLPLPPLVTISINMICPLHIWTLDKSASHT